MASVTFLLGVELGVEVYFVVSRASVTYLLGMEQGFVVLFGVKGVDDVLAGREAGCLWWCVLLRSSRASVTCLLSVLRSSSQLSRASVTWLAGRGAVGTYSLVSSASMTCLLDVEQGFYGGVYGDGAVDGFFSRIFRGFRALPGCPGVERQFLEPSMVKSSSPSRAPHAN